MTILEKKILFFLTPQTIKNRNKIVVHISKHFAKAFAKFIKIFFKLKEFSEGLCQTQCPWISKTQPPWWQ